MEVPINSFYAETRLDGVYRMTEAAFDTWYKTIDRADLRGIFTIDGKQFSITEFSISFMHDKTVELNIEARAGIFRYYDYNDKKQSWELKGSSNLVNAPNS